MKSPTIRMLVTVFLGFLGVHKFMEGKVGMGFLYLFTVGLGGIGWIVDSCKAISLWCKWIVSPNKHAINPYDSNSASLSKSNKTTKEGKSMQFILILLGLALIVYVLGAIWPFLLFFALVFIIFKIYAFFYYRSRKFKDIKQRIDVYINDCNDLNSHIESLKNTGLISNRVDYGDASYYDTSSWNYKRKHLEEQRYAPNVHNCSRNVCSNAQKRPFEYVCKYFGIKANEDTLSSFENILNNFEAAEEGKQKLRDEKEKILKSIKKDIPFLIRTFSKKKLEKKLGFEQVDMSTAYFPKYVFEYVSPGGNASMHCDVVMNIENLNKFILFLSEKIRFNKSVAGQRALMTSKLRQRIKERDNYTCQCCGVSVEQEPHLLLEIDHIVPVSKGGLTTEDNLQTLCWRCNRSKGAKL
nr:MAG TPA: TM2 domain [Caudoviricetes sp.]